MPTASQEKKKKKSRERSAKKEKKKKERKRRKEGKRMQKTSTVPNSGTIPTPPSFLIPTGAVQLSDVTVPNNSVWKLSSKLSRKCQVTDKKSISETEGLRKLQIPIESSEIAVYICAKKDHDGDIMAKHIESNTLSSLQIEKTHRSLILTRGSIQLKKLKGVVKLFSFMKKEAKSLKVSIFDLRGVHVSPSDNVVILAYREDSKEQQEGDAIRYAIYQTPEINWFFKPLASTLVSAYTGFPRWAIPVSWSGNVSRMPSVSRANYIQWMGVDGGFSTSVLAAFVSFHVEHKIEMRAEDGEAAISREILRQQPTRSFSSATNAPQFIDMMKLGEALTKDKPPEAVADIVLAGLRALSFNLVFRKLKLSNIKRDQFSPSLIAVFRNALAQTLLYNVTLREVDFEGSDLKGFGESLGSAWAMNAQPLISQINFSSCNLNGEDLRGILNGLARIWCGATALAESICMANNPNIPTEVWDVFFRTFVDPSTLSSWPKNPPPPPNLSFLQELDLRGTTAMGTGLSTFAKELKGLRSLKLPTRSGGVTAIDILRSLSMANAPLEIFEGNGLDCTCIQALFPYKKTLKKVVMKGFRGDPAPLLTDWPEPMPMLSVAIGSDYVSENNSYAEPTAIGFSPGSLSITNHASFGSKALDIIAASGASGLKTLVVHDMFYFDLARAAPYLAVCGLETLHIHRPVGGRDFFTRHTSFWERLAESKTLRDLRCQEQFRGGSDSNEVAMVGKFLKSNRSVRSISFDSTLLVLNVEDVKVLRSAFYGNKKVTSMEYPQNALVKTTSVINAEIALEEKNVNICKNEIQLLFKRAYSKYDRNWRDRPNRQKKPWVEKIRASKQKIGRLVREHAKIVALLDEIRVCITRNSENYKITEKQKVTERLERRKNQLNQLALKKRKVVTDLVKKLNKAKLRGRQKKSAKMQVPRSTYYKSENMWPSKTGPTKGPTKGHREHYHYGYHYFNDPYGARFYPYYPYFPHYGHGEFEGDVSSYRQNCYDSETNAAWDCMLSGVEDVSCEPRDPWENVDGLIQHIDSDYGSTLSTEYLATIHQECSELGIDVLEDVCSTLDTGAAVTEKLDEIGASVNTTNETLTSIVDSSLDEHFDLSAFENTLPDIPEYEFDAMDAEISPRDADDGGPSFGSSINEYDAGAYDPTGDEDLYDVMDAADAVGMYAGAGPRDLDDGGPSFGSSKNAVLAGARRCARARKNRKLMGRVRDNANRRLNRGYQGLRITETCRKFEVPSTENNTWPINFLSLWTEKMEIEQVKAMAESDFFDLPNVSGQSHSLLTEWSLVSENQQYLSSEIDVVLVTQCSLDRLPNLEAQLGCWTGKASVAIYVKPTERKSDAMISVLSTIENARKRAKENIGVCAFFDVAVTIVEGFIENEPYPINYLRNVALLEARTQHLRFNTSLEKSAALLVDVDFQPSSKLYDLVHSRSAAESILKKRRVIVCPAFESKQESCPHSIASLSELVENGEAEGFHRSHFPEGHGPTRFEKFWDKSLQCPTDENADEYCWTEVYKIEYEELFEPYVIMASADIPLYDERFQGYGLNKVSHLATVAAQKKNEFFVLPGAFLVAPAHERSEAWATRYGGSNSDEKTFNQLELKGLYYNFMKNLKAGREPVVSENTRSKHLILLERQKESEQRESESDSCDHMDSLRYSKSSVLCY